MLRPFYKESFNGTIADLICFTTFGDSESKYVLGISGDCNGAVTHDLL